MGVKVYWTPKAIESFNRVLDYLEASWSEKVIDDFIKKVKKTLSLIESGKVKFRSTEKKNVHEVLVTKHNLLIYR